MERTLDWIDDGLWVGPAPRSEADYAHLAGLGIQDVLSLQTETEARLCGIPHEDALKMASRHGLTLVRVPIRDFDVRSMAAAVPEAVRVLRDLRGRDRSVFVHCAVGINRSPTVVAGYLALTYRLSGAQACNRVMALHTCAPDRHVVGTIAGH